MKDNALYLEADEDITSAIDKLSKSPASSVQIVVPKRSTMLQSIINLKLLKKAAETHGKELILVTNDRIAGELAGRVGLPVASSLGAAPRVSEAEIPADLKSGEEVIEENDPDPPKDEPKPKAGKLSRGLPLLKHKEVSDEPPALEPPAPELGTGPAPDAPEAPIAGGKNKGPKVPNFKKLTRRVMWLGFAAVMVAGYFVAMYFLTNAKVTLYANGTKVDIDTTFSADPTLKQTDQGKAVLAAQNVTVSKDLTGPFTPTGKKDAGTKASGTMTVYNEYDTNAHTLVAGTRFQAPDGKMFRTSSDASVPGATVGLEGGKIVLNPGKAEGVGVEADQSGDSYNEAPARYTIPGYTGEMQTKIYGQGAQMSGGTSRVITVVTENDVDSAKAALLAKDKDNATRDLSGRVPSGYVALTQSQSQTVDSTTSAPAVGAEGSTATLALKVTYSVLSVKDSEYHDLVKAQEEKQIGDNNQVYDDGTGVAQLTAGDKDAAGRRSFHFTTTAFAGAKLDTAAIAGQVKGKRYGDASDIVKNLPGVARADITVWPGWATSLPSRPDKIKVIIQVAGNKG